MARGVNKVILVGNVGQDPEVRFTQAGAPVANLNLATTDMWNDRQSGARQERTEWHRLVFFNGLADVVSKYVTKGTRLYIEGRLQTRKWQDQGGNDRYSTEIVVNEMNIEGGGRKDNQPSQHPGSQPSNHGNQGGGYQGNSANAGHPASGNQQPNAPQNGMGAGQEQSVTNNQNIPQNNPANQQESGGAYGAPNPDEYGAFDDEIPFQAVPNIMGG